MNRPVLTLKRASQKSSRMKFALHQIQVRKSRKVIVRCAAAIWWRSR